MISFDRKLSVFELGGLVVNHYPEGTDLKGNPLEAELLYGTDTQDPDKYMLAFSEAGARVVACQGSAEREVSFMLEALNGARRRIGFWDKGQVQHWLDLIPRLLPLVSPSERKARLTELYLYHAGLVHHLFGDFDKAKEAQDKAARQAAARGDEQSATICEAQSAYERASGALMRGNQDDIRGALADLREKSFRLSSLDDSPTGKRWKLGNGPVHRLLLHLLAGEHYEMRARDLLCLLTLPLGSLGEMFSDEATLFTEMSNLKSGTPLEFLQRTVQECEIVAKHSAGGKLECLALALYLLGYAEEMMGNFEKARVSYLRAADMIPGHGAVLVRTFAARRNADLKLDATLAAGE